MIDLDERLNDELARLVPLPDGRDASWTDALARAGVSRDASSADVLGRPKALSRRRGRRRRQLIAVFVTALVGMLALTPLGGAIRGELGDFSAWLTGRPGEPASESVQADFDRANERSWAGFPDGPQLRRLITSDAVGAKFELFGFRTGDSLCLRLAVSGMTDAPATACAPLAELRAARDPVLVVVTDYSFGRQQVEPTDEGLIPPRASATFGIVADGIDSIELASNRGRHEAIVEDNAFLAIVERPPLGLRTHEAVAVTASGRRLPVAIAKSPFGQEQPQATPGVAPGPTVVERKPDGGTIGWLVRREPRGQSLEEAGSARRPFAFPGTRVEFARVLTPDPQSHMRVAVAVTEFGAGEVPPPYAKPGEQICSFMISRGGAGGGCSPADVLFSRGPFTVGTSVEHGGNQYAILSGLASDDVERMELFLATGERIAVPLKDNAYILAVARTKYPARLVGYDAAGRVIGIEAMAHDPLASSGPRPVKGAQRLVLTVVGANGTRGQLRVGPSSDGGRCWKVTFTGGAGGSGCPPASTKTPPVTLGMQDAGRDKFVTGQVAGSVAEVEIRFASGKSTRVEPVERFILYPIPAGEELLVAIGYDDSGAEVGRWRFR